MRDSHWKISYEASKHTYILNLEALGFTVCFLVYLILLFKKNSHIKEKAQCIYFKQK